MSQKPSTSRLRVLIVCYYWPPAGGPGVQRWLKFVKYLPDYKIDPVVVIPQNPSYPIVDKNIGNDLPHDPEIISVPIKEPNQWLRFMGSSGSRAISSGMIPVKEKQSWLQRLMLYIRGNYFIPDARKFWVSPASKAVSKYLKENPVDVLITTGPPHSVHLIGERIKKELPQLTWITDFRDPWTTIGYHKELKLSSRSKRAHQRMEQRILDSADHVLVTSPGLEKVFREQTQTMVTTITNGFDAQAHSAEAKPEHFLVAHIGSLLSDRNPQILWEALAELSTEHKQFGKDLKLVLAGKVSSSVLETIKSKGLDGQLDYRGYLSHTEAIRLQEESAMLLLIEIDSEETEVIIPGKLFEYLRARRPIVALGPEKADFRLILKETESGAFFTYSQKKELKSHIYRNYKLFCRGELNLAPAEIQQYSRKSLTGKLATLLHQLKAD